MPCQIVHKGDTHLAVFWPAVTKNKCKNYRLFNDKKGKKNTPIPYDFKAGIYEVYIQNEVGQWDKTRR